MYCNSCVEDYHRCVVCGCLVHANDVEQYQDSVYCQCCAESLPRIIYDYHDGPGPLFYDTTAPKRHQEGALEGERYYGIELEIDTEKRLNCEETAEELLGIVNADDEEHWYACHDGSHSDRGFELISHPMTYEYFCSYGHADKVRGMMDNAAKIGYRGHDTSTCGLHFHVSKSSLAGETIASMILAVDLFWDIVVTISRRTEDNIERWARRYNLVNGVDDKIKHAKEIATDRTIGRYFALNTTNPDTVELHIFRSTLKLRNFHSLLAFLPVPYQILRKIHGRTNHGHDGQRLYN